MLPSLSLAALLTLPAQPPAAPANPPADAKLDTHLARWEKAAQGLTNFRMQHALTRTDGVFRKSREFTGSVTVMRPNLIRLRAAAKADPNDWVEFVCDGKAVYLYEGPAKTITEFRLDPKADQDTLMLALLGGTKADELKKRFRVSFLKEDDFYVY